MLDIKFIRENQELVKEAARKKHIQFDIDVLIAIDEKRRSVLSSIEEKRAKQNAMSELIVRTTDEREKQSLILDMKGVKGAKELEEESMKEVMKEWQKLMVQVPNIPDVSVPDGVTEEENQSIKNGERYLNLVFQSKIM